MEHLEPINSLEEKLCIRAQLQGIPINGILELTPLCNMNCDMCFVRLSRQEMERQGRLLSGDEWLAMAEEMQKAGTLFLLLTGGEPLTHPDFQKIYLGLRRMGFVLTINTNGTLIDEKWADFFGKHKPRRINITLYGADDRAYEEMCHNAGGYDRTIRAIALLRDRGVDVKVNGSIVPSNFHACTRIADIAKSMQVTSKIDTYMYPATRERGREYAQQSRLTPEQAAAARVRLWRNANSEEAFRSLAEAFIAKAEEAKNSPPTPNIVRCRAGGSAYVVNWQGIMRPCIMVTTPAEPLLGQDFSQTWKKIKEKTKAIRTCTACSDCGYRTICQTCAACCLLEGGSYDAKPEYMCRYTQETLRLLREEIHG